MTATVTLVPAIRARIFEMLKLGAAADVDVMVGDPGEGYGPDVIWLHGHVEVDCQSASMGQYARQEVSTHVVIAESTVPGGSHSDAEQRVQVLYDFIAGLFVDPRALALDGVLSAQIVRYLQTINLGGSGAFAGIEVHVQVSARLT